MIIRYDFGEKLDLSRFQKQAPRQIGSMRQVTFNFYIKDYLIFADIVTPDDLNTHQVCIKLYRITRNQDKEITRTDIIIPQQDTQFKNIQNIAGLFAANSHQSFFDSNSVDQTVDCLSTFIKTFYKIDGLKVFL